MTLVWVIFRGNRPLVEILEAWSSPIQPTDDDVAEGGEMRLPKRDVLP